MITDALVQWLLSFGAADCLAGMKRTKKVWLGKENS